MRAFQIQFLFLLSLTGCLPINTSDPESAFKNWAGYPPPDEFKILEGEYYKSAHFTYEFEVYLKMIPSEDWWNKLINQYELSEDYTSWSKPENAPEWFTPSNKLIMYSRHQEFDQSRFFKDTISAGVYVYEVHF